MHSRQLPRMVPFLRNFKPLMFNYYSNHGTKIITPLSNAKSMGMFLKYMKKPLGRGLSKNNYFSP